MADPAFLLDFHIREILPLSSSLAVGQGDASVAGRGKPSGSRHSRRGSDTDPKTPLDTQADKRKSGELQNVSDHKKCGFLLKEGNVRKLWKRRWFVLDFRQKQLFYYLSRSAPKPRGIMTFEECAVQVLDKSSSTPFSFRVSCRMKGKKYKCILSADSRQEMLDWISAVHEVARLSGTTAAISLSEGTKTSESAIATSFLSSFRAMWTKDDAVGSKHAGLAGVAQGDTASSMASPSPGPPSQWPENTGALYLNPATEIWRNRRQDRLEWKLLLERGVPMARAQSGCFGNALAPTLRSPRSFPDLQNVASMHEPLRKPIRTDARRTLESLRGRVVTASTPPFLPVLHLCSAWSVDTLDELRILESDVLPYLRRLALNHDIEFSLVDVSFPFLNRGPGLPHHDQLLRGELLRTRTHVPLPPLPHTCDPLVSQSRGEPDAPESLWFLTFLGEKGVIRTYPTLTREQYDELLSLARISRPELISWLGRIYTKDSNARPPVYVLDHLPDEMPSMEQQRHVMDAIHAVLEETDYLVRTRGSVEGTLDDDVAKSTSSVCVSPSDRVFTPTPRRLTHGADTDSSLSQQNSGGRPTHRRSKSHPVPPPSSYIEEATENSTDHKPRADNTFSPRRPPITPLRRVKSRGRSSSGPTPESSSPLSPCPSPSQAPTGSHCSSSPTSQSPQSQFGSPSKLQLDPTTPPLAPVFPPNPPLAPIHLAPPGQGSASSRSRPPPPSPPRPSTASSVVSCAPPTALTATHTAPTIVVSADPGRTASALANVHGGASDGDESKDERRIGRDRHDDSSEGEVAPSRSSTRLSKMRRSRSSGFLSSLGLGGGEKGDKEKEKDRDKKRVKDRDVVTVKDGKSRAAGGVADSSTGPGSDTPPEASGSTTPDEAPRSPRRHSLQKFMKTEMRPSGLHVSTPPGSPSPGSPSRGGTAENQQLSPSAFSGAFRELTQGLRWRRRKRPAPDEDLTGEVLEPGVGRSARSHSEQSSKDVPGPSRGDAGTPELNESEALRRVLLDDDDRSSQASCSLSRVSSAASLSNVEMHDSENHRPFRLSSKFDSRVVLNPDTCRETPENDGGGGGDDECGDDDDDGCGHDAHGELPSVVASPTEFVRWRRLEGPFHCREMCYTSVEYAVRMALSVDCDVRCSSSRGTPPALISRASTPTTPPEAASHSHDVSDASSHSCSAWLGFRATSEPLRGDSPKMQ
eukprot:Rmarinus@m.16067